MLKYHKGELYELITDKVIDDLDQVRKAWTRRP